MIPRRFYSEWLGHFGATTGARLLGWCAMTALRMPPGVEPSRETLLEYGWGSVSTRYRNLHALEGFGESMRAKGVTFDDDPSAGADAAVRLLRGVTA